MLNIFDTTFNGMPHSEMYRAWVDPTCFPGQPVCRLENWDPEDVLDYCGPSEAAAHGIPASPGLGQKEVAQLATQ